MGENKSHLLNHHYPNPPSSSSRLGQKSSSKTIGGEIVEVHGGHIVRSTGRKDRHSKVCTAKGPRDRRVRLAAHTAIQFYDVQDRLGYDRPSKAVDWLIKKAKASIDELAQLPPWHPLGCNNAGSQDDGHDEQGKKIQEEQVGSEEKGNTTSDLNAQDSSFLPPQLDSHSIIADTVKSFFPTATAAAAAAAAAADSSSSANAQFHSFATSDFMSRSGHSQDLNLSLQSFQESISMNNHHHPTQQTVQQHVSSQAHHVLLGGGNPVGYDGNYSFSWLDQSNQRLLHGQPWNSMSGADLFGPQTASPQPMLQQLLGGQDGQFFATQRGPLQSSNNTNTPTVHSWMDQFPTVDHHHQHQGLIVPVYHPSSSVSGIGFASGIGGGYAGFHVPARIRGDNEDRIDGFSDNPSSASSDSRH